MVRDDQSTRRETFLFCRGATYASTEFPTHSPIHMLRPLSKSHIKYTCAVLKIIKINEEVREFIRISRFLVINYQTFSLRLTSIFIIYFFLACEDPTSGPVNELPVS